MDNKLLCTEGDWKIFDGMSRIEGEWDIYGDNDILATVTTIEDAHLIAASKDLYNSLFSIIETEIPKREAGIPQISRSSYNTAIEALKKANPNYKP